MAHIGRLWLIHIERLRVVHTERLWVAYIGRLRAVHIGRLWVAHTRRLRVVHIKRLRVAHTRRLRMGQYNPVTDRAVWNCWVWPVTGGPGGQPESGGREGRSPSKAPPATDPRQGAGEAVCTGPGAGQALEAPGGWQRGGLGQIRRFGSPGSPWSDSGKKTEQNTPMTGPSSQDYQ